MEKIKTTLIGAGYRGKQLLQFLQNFPFFEVMAVADPYIEETDIPEIVCYNNGEEDYLNMLSICTQITGRDDLYQKNGLDVQKEVEEMKQRADGSNPTVLFLRAASSNVKAKGSDGNVCVP